MKNYLLIALAVMLLASCSPSSKLRRAKKLIAQAEAAGLEWSSDTVFTTITDTIPKIEIDTVFRDFNFTDTLVLIRRDVVTKVKFSPKEVYVYTKCPERIVTRTVTHTINRKINAGPSTWDRIKFILIGFAIGVILTGLFAVFRR